MNDDMYPNDSETFQGFPDEPADQVEEKQVEQSKVMASVPVINEVLEWLDKAVNFYGNTDAIDIHPGVDPVSGVVAMCTAKGMKNEFELKAREFRSTFADHLKEKVD